MKEGEVVIGLAVPTAVNFLLLYNKYDKWFSSPYKWYAVAGLFIAAIAMLQFLKFNDEDWYLALRAALTPMVIALLDYAFKRLSLLAQGRDYYLWFKDMVFINEDWNYSFLDKLFTIVLAVFIMIMPLILVLIYRK
ncbi:hypothetical protein IDJ77_10285 [Mucilaginibacter sp. ZT4R22]|uniref:Transmembrane family 220 protein n=1 Tax=Mucilaginibacter pankratovii TaxID=2772110 RepID=A0ABR7WPH8_9SPHI|nr:hypothetical protein [Mucilaginibacter pankratovii]MBD1364197.1 hypothetical protein [Mucilaginibacter pankratovii]